MTKYTELLQKEAEKLAKMDIDKLIATQPRLQATGITWETMKPEHKAGYIEKRMVDARYVLEARAESYKQGRKHPAFNDEEKVNNELTGLGYIEQKEGTENGK